MAKDTSISWTHHTFNPWRGCTKVSAGCAHCYAETLSGRNPGTLGVWGKHGSRVIAADNYWKQPIRWNRDAERAGERRRVFCASLADVFEGPESMPADAVEAVTEARRRLFGLILDTPWLDWLLLTKRPQNVPLMVPMTLGADGQNWMRDGFPPNVWIGTSVENQAAADVRIPELLKIPAPVRFLSCEPLLGSVELPWEALTPMFAADDPRYYQPGGRGVDWVIVGGESGPGARPMHPEWVRSLRDQCVDAGVAFHFKQWGEWCPGEYAQDGVFAGYWQFAQGNMFHEGHHGRPEDQTFLGPDANYKRRTILRLPEYPDLAWIKLGKDWSGRRLGEGDWLGWKVWDEFPTGGINDGR